MIWTNENSNILRSNINLFACRCCHVLLVKPELINAFAKIREWCVVEYGKEPFITCAYRCPTHNAAVGGKANSRHIEGSAIDILPITGIPWESFYGAAKVYFGGVLDEGDHWHLQLDRPRT